MKHCEKWLVATMHMYKVIIFMNEKMHESASADVIFVASSLRIHGSSHKHYMGWVILVELVREREIFKAFREENTFIPCVHECSTPCRQEGLVLHECPEVLDERQLPNDLLVFTAVIKLSAFTDDFVKPSSTQF